MSLIIDVLVLVLMCSIYAVIHSLLASEKIKNIVSEKTGKLFAFYRFFYVAFAVILLYLLIETAPRLDIVIYDLNYPYDLFTLILQLVAVFGFYWAIRYTCAKEFFGFSQIGRYLNGSYSEAEGDENLYLMKLGPYKYMRHPYYFFIILFMLARPFMDLQYLIFCICAVIYFYIGGYYEERKLINKFGNEYLEYMSKVPKIVPYKIFRGKIG